MCFVVFKTLKKKRERERLFQRVVYSVKNLRSLRKVNLDKLAIVYSSLNGPAVEFNEATADADCEWRLQIYC